MSGTSPLNRETFKDIPGGTSADVTSRYDLSGRRTFARFGGTLTPSNDCSANNTGVDYCYDTVGRLLYETSYGRRLTFGYDPASNRNRITHPDGIFFQYSYDALNRVDQIGEAGVFTGVNLIADYAYDAQSRRVSLGRGPNQPTTTYTYTQASRLAGLNHDLASGPDANWAYTYTMAGQLASRTVVSAYEWGVPALTDSYSRNGLNQYTSIDGTAISYDARGSLTSDGSRRFCYDLENRLIGAAPTATDPCVTPSTASILYDPLGRLRSYTAAGTTTEFLYDDDRLVAEYVGANVARRYVHGSGVDEPLMEYVRQTNGTYTRFSLIADRQGSIVASIDAAGVATVYRYGPYGEPDSWSGSRFSYTGQIMLPELQLYHYKARAYSPSLGRFYQTDPVGYEADMNLYAYVRNDPLNLADPEGLDPSCSDPPCPDVPLPARETREQAAQAVGQQRGQHETGANTYENPATGDTMVVTGSDAGRPEPLPGGREGFRHDTRRVSEGGTRPDGWRTILRTHTHGRFRGPGARGPRLTRENDRPSDEDQDALRDTNRPVQIVGPRVTGTLFRMDNQDYFQIDRGTPDDVGDVSGEGIVVIGPEEDER